jgi:hypothetical protein
MAASQSMHHLLALQLGDTWSHANGLGSQPTAYLIWCAIRGLFLNNANQRAAYPLQEFHGLFQGDLSVHDYFSCLKQLDDLLHDVGYPVSDPAMVINTLCGLNSKFSHAISVLTARKPLPTFLFTRGYLLQEEAHQKHTAKMEAVFALVAGTTPVPPTWPPVPPQVPTPPPSYSPSKNSDKNNNKKCNANDNKKTSSPSTGMHAATPPWSTSFNPWTGLVQAWPLPIWHPYVSGLLGP